MILHIENGRLGNQLFQYIGLKKYFPKDKIMLTSECGFGHVPIDIVRAKVKKLVSVAQNLRE